MLAPPLRLSHRLAIIALLLFSALFLYHTSYDPESWITSTIPQPKEPDERRPDTENADNLPESTTTSLPISTEPSHDNEPASPEIPPAAPPTPDSASDLTPAPPEPDPAVDELVDGVIVMGKLQSEDTSWVHEELPNWPTAIYSVDNTSAALSTPLNKGREALPYLTYIIDHYASLPATLLFLHPHARGYPSAWHTDAPDHSNAWSVTHLHLPTVRDRGYVNLRCTHVPGCPAEIRPKEGGEEVDRAVREAWGSFFGEEVPEVVAAACCAQFAVSRERVWTREREEYVRMREWVVRTEWGDAVSGRAMEYLWHVVFGRGVVDCPPQDQCFWDVYRLRTSYDG